MTTPEHPAPAGRRAQRRRRRTRTLVVSAIAVVALVGAGVGGWMVLADGDDDGRVATQRAAERRSPSTTAAPSTTTVTEPPTTTTTVPAGPPYALGVTRLTVEDMTRGTMARGPTPASPTRKLPVAVYYPTSGPAGAPVGENVPTAPGQWPLMLFIHGYAITAADYEPLIKDLAAQGFVVVAPDLPIASLVFPGPPSQADLPNQALDVRFLIDVFTNPASVPAVLQGKIAPGKVSVTGHSDGGVTVAAASGNSCCLDPRIGASAALAGDQGGGLFRHGQWFQPGAAPQLFIHGTADADVPYAFSQKLYADTVVTRYLVSIPGGVHWDPFVSGPERPAIVKLMVDFFRAYSLGDAAALARIPADANEGGLRLEASA